MTSYRKLMSRVGRAILGALLCMSCGGMFAETRLASAQERAAQQVRKSCGAAKSELDARLLAPSAIAQVAPLYAVSHGKHGIERRLLGAQLQFPAQKGVTAEWLERTLKCHGAREALEATAQNRASPYFLPDSWVEIDVESLGDGFLVTLRGEDGEAARRILERAQSYVLKGV